MPDVGLEPTATRLKGVRSTDWANQATYMVNKNISYFIQKQDNEVPE